MPSPKNTSNNSIISDHSDSELAEIHNNNNKGNQQQQQQQKSKKRVTYANTSKNGKNYKKGQQHQQDNDADGGVFSNLSRNNNTTTATPPVAFEDWEDEPTLQQTHVSASQAATPLNNKNTPPRKASFASFDNNNNNNSDSDTNNKNNSMQQTREMIDDTNLINHRHHCSASLNTAEEDGDHHNNNEGDDDAAAIAFMSHSANNNNSDKKTYHTNNTNNNSVMSMSENSLDTGSFGSGDPDSEGDPDGLGSSISGSSGTSKGTKGLKSSLPFAQYGFTIVHMMTIVIMVPILFLVIPLIIELSDSIAADNFLSKHRPVFTGIRNLGDYNLWERLNSTFLIILNENDAGYAKYRHGADTARSLFNNDVLDFTENVMRESDLENRFAFMRDLDILMRSIDVDRQKIDSKTANPPAYRDRQIELMDEMTGLLLYFSHDPRGERLRNRIVLYVLVRRIQNVFSSMLGSAVGSINAIGLNDEDSFVENIRALQSSSDRVTSDLEMAVKSSDKEMAVDLLEVRNSEAWNKWRDTVALLLQDNRSLYADIITEDNLTTWFNRASFEFDSVDRRLLARITNGELLKEVTVESALVMAFAVLCSLGALAVVIYYNNKEQKRMEKALDATAVLANAVQRFVPKNQLKTMGVRSITQVTPGMTTEVAQTITFSDIRGFTRLSESMTRLELFDWLQNYVSRMTKVVSEEKSYIMAFLGDGLGICSPQPTYALNAAVKMHVSVEELNLNLIAKNGTLPIKIGVGVNHGVVVAGVFGDDSRLTCSMIAPDVNFASRLEALTKSFGVKILASESTIDHISPDVFCYRKVGTVQVKGSSSATKVFDVYNADDLKDKQFKDETKKEFEHAVSIFESDPPEAVKIFENLVLRARVKGRSDESCEMYRKRFNNNGSACTSVLSFEKDGELKNENNNNNASGVVNSESNFGSANFDNNTSFGSPSMSPYASANNLKRISPAHLLPHSTTAPSLKKEDQPLNRLSSSVLTGTADGSSNRAAASSLLTTAVHNNNNSSSHNPFTTKNSANCSELLPGGFDHHHHQKSTATTRKDSDQVGAQRQDDDEDQYTDDDYVLGNNNFGINDDDEELMMKRRADRETIRNSTSLSSTTAAGGGGASCHP